MSLALALAPNGRLIVEDSAGVNLVDEAEEQPEGGNASWPSIRDHATGL